jgi:hypothetical protein
MSLNLQSLQSDAALDKGPSLIPGCLSGKRFELSHWHFPFRFLTCDIGIVSSPPLGCVPHTGRFPYCPRTPSCKKKGSF